ncbi:MAG: HAD-IA family hydrolase [Chitinivibrionales bacterium]|nr:HAD-IA family hydrolase [Chitinivibrionales bacterium]
MKAAIFDLFGTLVPYVGRAEFAESLALTATALDLPPERLIADWCNRQRFLAWMTNPDSSEERIRKYVDRCSLKMTAQQVLHAADTLRDAHRQWLRPLPSSLATLRELVSRGYRLGLMSVCSKEVREVWGETDFADCFDEVVLSCEQGATKNTPKLYRHALCKLDVPAENVFYIGDTQEELGMARQSGMKPIWMRARHTFQWDGWTVLSPLQVLDYLQ